MRRARVQWQLVLVVTAIAVLACTLISSLGLLIAATELGAVRSALTSASGEETDIRVTLTQPLVPVAEARDALESTIDDVLGDAAAPTSQALALSVLYSLPTQGAPDPLFYLGELDAIEKHAHLTSGSWPTADSQVAIPDAGAAQLGLAVGDTLAMKGTTPEQPSRTVAISGVFHISDPESLYWRGDLLEGLGLDPQYPVPGFSGGLETNAIGPLVVPAGMLDADGIAVERLVLQVTPDFSTTTVESLAPLQTRLIAAPKFAPASIGDIAGSVEITSSLTTLISAVTTTMAVTRSIVVVVSLLLFVLAVAALAQAARLLTEERASERHLMRARGSSARQLLGLAGVEALLVAGITIVLSPLLARLVYLVVAQQPAMVAAGMSADSGIPAVVWVMAIAIAALFWLVLVAPTFGREGSFHEAEQGKARPRRFSGLQRSGVDVALLVLAGVAYSQLLAYQGPTSASQLGVDPILVAGPALVLLAGAFLAVRLIPAAGVITERLAAQSRGAVLALAAWEIGRRAQRATAAILLITLALAVGTFSLSFLSTWRQSQVDQSAFALGAPLRLTSDSDVVVVPQAAQPVMRSEGLLAGANTYLSWSSEPHGEAISVLGLTPDSRELLQRNRLGDEGGSIIADAIQDPTVAATRVPLPADTLGLSASISATSATELSGIDLRLRMLVEDSYGHQSVIDMGTVPIDGDEHRVSGTLPGGTALNGLSIVAFQAVTFAKHPDLDSVSRSTDTELLIRDLSSMGTPDENTPAGGYPSRPVEVDTTARWHATGTGSDTGNQPSATSREGWQLGLDFTIPPSGDPQASSFVEMGWSVRDEIPAVITAQLADAVGAEKGDQLTVITQGVAINVVVLAVTPAVPGGGSDATVNSLGAIGKDADTTVVLDEVQLARALFEAGVVDSGVHEWWMDSAPGQSAGYIRYLAVQYDQLTAQSAELLALQMQQDPLRVATQGALWLVIFGAAALAAIGFAVHATGSLRSRATEFAQLRAVGLSRRRLSTIIGIESLLLCVLGTLFGVGLGLVLAYLVGPLVGVSGDGSTPVPPVSVQIPGAQIALLAALLAGVLVVVVVVAARVQRVAQPASALRQGDDR